MKCVFSGIPGFIIPLKITCGALKPPSAPAGLFILLGLTALVQPSRGRVTLLMSVYRVTGLTDLFQIDHGDEGRDRVRHLNLGDESL